MPSDTAAPLPDAHFDPAERLHPASWIFVAVHNLKQALFALIGSFVLGAGRDGGLWFPLVIIVPTIAAALWHQWVYRYGFSTRGLVVHEGLFFRTQRTIDYGRIENVDTERGLLHRLFGVAEVRVETSTGGKPEAQIRVLGLDHVRGMRERIFAQRSVVAPASGPAADSEPRPRVEDDEETLLALPPGELVRFGLIDNRGLLVIAAALGVLSQSGLFNPNRAGRDDGVPRTPRIPSAWVDSAGDLVSAWPVLVIGAVLALVVSLRILSIVVALVTLYGFRLTRNGDDLRARYGLLTQVSATLRRRRIQAVHQTATLLHRLFGRVSLRVDLAGGISAQQGADQSGQIARRDTWLAPLIENAGAERLIQAALPDASLDGLDWAALPRKARGRHFRRLAAFWMPALAVPTALLAENPVWALAAAAAPVAPLLLHATMTHRHTAWALTPQFFVLRRGWMTRKLSIMPRNRVQSVRVTVSPFDRRHRMASIDLDHAGAGSLSHRIGLTYLMYADAKAIQAQLTGGDGAVSRPPSPPLVPRADDTPDAPLISLP